VKKRRRESLEETKDRKKNEQAEKRKKEK